MDLESFYSNLLLQWQVIRQALTPLLMRLCMDKPFSLVTTSPWVRTCGATTPPELSWNLVGHVSREHGCVRDITSSLAGDWFQSWIWKKNVKQRQSPLEGMREVTHNLMWDWGVPLRLVMDISIHPERQLLIQNPKLCSTLLQKEKKTNQCRIPCFRCSVTGAWGAELTWTSTDTHTYHIYWGPGTALTCQFDHAVFLLFQSEEFAKS